ncbi:hypothetical protein BJY52DRAFT_666382 [Lactarius psammicola]|nr:hypothetical protein BJY52DRAFT_666382 [Lactarius psammicola]
MIIPADESPSSRKPNQQQVSPPPPGGPSPPPPPPPYTSRHQSTTHYVVAATFLPPQEPAGRRFIKAFLVAMLIWFLTGAFVSSCLDLFGVIRLASQQSKTATLIIAPPGLLYLIGGTRGFRPDRSGHGRGLVSVFLLTQTLSIWLPMVHLHPATCM